MMTSHKLCEHGLSEILRAYTAKRYQWTFALFLFRFHRTLFGTYFGRGRLGCNGEGGGVKSTVTSTGRNCARPVTVTHNQTNNPQ
jgi:hypothetical protein